MLERKTIMTKIKSLVVGCVFSLFLSITVLAGEMPGSGKPAISPKSGSTKLDPTTSEPVVTTTDQTTSTYVVYVEATLNPITEATIIAIQFVIGVW